MADFKDFLAGRSAATLDGTEKIPVLDDGVTKFTTPNAIAALAAGTTDHGALTGLSDDDHPQYHTDARGDARYSALGHNHAGVYEAAGAVSTHAALITVHGISAFGATLVDDASASAARTTLGLGSAATLTAGTAANNAVQLDGSARLPAVDGSQLTGLSRVVTGSIASGIVTIDCANVRDVVVNLTLTANVTSVVYQNLPTVCRVRWAITQSGGPWTFPANSWPAGTTVDGTYYLYTDATVTRMLWETANSGPSASLQTNAPFTGLTTADVDDTPVNGETAAPVSSNWAFDHAALTQAHGISAFGATLVDDASASAARTTLGLGTAATAATGDFAPAAQGVTNGNSHDHNGGDGAQIAYANLSGTPTITAAAQTVLDDATVVAMVDTLGGASSTGSGGIARQTSPTFITPSLGTPASGTLTNCTGLPTAGIVNNAVTNAKAAQMVASTIKGRVTASTGDPEDMTAAQARSIIEAAAPSVVTITGSTTLTKAAHQGKRLYCTTGALNLTVDNSTDFDAYASCEIVNKTGAAVTFVATATINRIGSKPLTLPANGMATLMREATADVYLLTGEMA